MTERNEKMIKSEILFELRQHLHQFSNEKTENFEERLFNLVESIFEMIVEYKKYV